MANSYAAPGVCEWASWSAQRRWICDPSSLLLTHTTKPLDSWIVFMDEAETVLNKEQCCNVLAIVCTLLQRPACSDAAVQKRDTGDSLLQAP